LVLFARISLHLAVSLGIAVSSGGDGPETLLTDASAARRSVAS
jgi:hypothetical protein